MTISQTITVYTGDAPNSDTMESAAEFDAAANTFAAYIEVMPGELNTWATEANALATTVNDAKTAAVAAANFAGNWSDLTGAVSVPTSVKHNSQYWMLLNNLADVTLSEPAAGSADWSEIHEYENVIISTDIVSISVVAEAAYPSVPETDVLYIVY